MTATSRKINDILSEIDNLPYLSDAGLFENSIKYGIYDGYISIEKHLIIDKEDKALLREYFYDAGTNMLSAEKENVSRCISSFEDKYESVKGQLASKKRVSSTVIVCVTLLIVLFII